MNEIEQFRAEYRAMVEYGEAEAVFKLVERLLARLREVQEEANKWANQAVADCGNAIYWRDKHDHAEAERDQLRQQLVEKEQDLHFQVLEWAAAQAQLTTLREALTEALDEWAYAADYKGDYLAAKHGDKERIAELRALAPRPAPKESK